VEDDLDFADGASSEDELEKCRKYFNAMHIVHMLSFFGYLVISVPPAYSTVVSLSLLLRYDST